MTELLLIGINQRMGYKNRNILWVDPYWLDKIPDGSRVVLYGGGEIEYNADIHKYDADMHDGVSP